MSDIKQMVDELISENINLKSRLLFIEEARLRDKQAIERLEKTCFDLESQLNAARLQNDEKVSLNDYENLEHENDRLRNWYENIRIDNQRLVKENNELRALLTTKTQENRKNFSTDEIDSRIKEKERADNAEKEIEKLKRARSVSDESRDLLFQDNIEKDKLIAELQEITGKQSSEIAKLQSKSIPEISRMHQRMIDIENDKVTLESFMEELDEVFNKFGYSINY